MHKVYLVSTPQGDLVAYHVDNQGQVNEWATTASEDHQDAYAQTKSMVIQGTSLFGYAVEEVAMPEGSLSSGYSFTDVLDWFKEWVNGYLPRADQCELDKDQSAIIEEVFDLLDRWQATPAYMREVGEIRPDLYDAAKLDELGLSPKKLIDRIESLVAIIAGFDEDTATRHDDYRAHWNGGE